MDKARALKLIHGQVEILTSLEYSEDNPAIATWRRDTRVILENVFGPDSPQVKEFGRIHFNAGVISYVEQKQLLLNRDGFNEGKSRALPFLESVVREIEQFWPDSEPAEGSPASPLDIVLKLCGRFDKVARRIQDRYDTRPTISIKDEYDVQDLMHALLTIDFDDIRREEGTPSFAGKGARMDFVLKDHQIVLEAKKTRKGLTGKEVGDELLIDIARYKTHPDCKTLVCFIYDPEAQIKNPAGMEKDLTRDHDGLKVVAIVNPK